MAGERLHASVVHGAAEQHEARHLVGGELVVQRRGLLRAQLRHGDGVARTAGRVLVQQEALLVRRPALPLDARCHGGVLPAAERLMGGGGDAYLEATAAALRGEATAAMPAMLHQVSEKSARL